MNKNYLIIGVIVIVVVFLFTQRGTNDNSLKGIPNVPSYSETNSNNTSSSSVFEIGIGVSSRILQPMGGRGYARICNDQATNKLYLAFRSTAINATSSASTVVAVNNCYEITRDNLWTGTVHAISETASTTKITVTEFIGI